MPEIVTRLAVHRFSSMRRMRLPKIPTLPTIPEIPDVFATSLTYLSSFVPSLVAEDPPVTETGPKRRRIEDVLAVEAEILGVHQLKEILTENMVANDDHMDKAELVKRFKALQEEIRHNRQRITLDLAEDSICKVCKKSSADCILLECGHVVSCSQCANSLKDCPMCGELVVRAIRTTWP